MFDEKERENMNKVGYNTENISSQIINEEAEKLAKEVAASEKEAQSVQNVSDNISIGPNGLYNMSQSSNQVENNQVYNESSNVLNSNISDNTQTNNTEVPNVNNNQYDDYIKRAQATPENNVNMGGFIGGFNNSFDNNLYQMNNMNNKNKKATKKMPIFKKFVLTAAAVALITVTCFGGYVGYNKYKDLNDKVNALSNNSESETQIKLTTSNKSKDKGVVKNVNAVFNEDVGTLVSKGNDINIFGGIKI